MKTELVLYLVPGNISKLIRWPLGKRIPLVDYLAPPEPLRVGPTIPVDPNSIAWKVPLVDSIYEFAEAPSGERRVHFLHPKGIDPPSREWVRRAVENMNKTVH